MRHADRPDRIARLLLPALVRVGNPRYGRLEACATARLALLLVCFLLAHTSRAQTVIHQQFTNLNLTIPDNDPSGAADVRTIRGVAPGSIVLDVNVTLKLTGSGARNGDLYATLDHQSGYTVLLNRVGRRLGNAVGYEDAGLEVTFDDEAANGDIHQYRATLFGNHDTSVRQPLASIWAGEWAPDGRNVDPDAVSETSARRASLGSMKGLPVDGRWQLFIADLAPGGVSQLVEWSLNIRASTNLNDLKMDLINATIRANGQDRVIVVPMTIQGDLAVTGGAGTTLSGPVSGPGQIVKGGGGTLTLSGVNTFSGGVALEEGALVLSNDRGIGLGPVKLKGGSLAASGGAKRVDNALTLAGDATFGRGDTLEFAGLVTLQGKSPLKVENETVISGDIEESEPGGGFIKSGGGKLTLVGVNSFSGGIQLDEGTLALGGDRALGTGPLKLTGGKVEATGGARTVANPLELAGKLAFVGADLLSFTGPIKLNGDTALTVENTTTLSGPLSEATPGLGFVKAGNGTLVLEGANTISGGVNLEEGQLMVNNLTGSATGSGAVSVKGNSTLGGSGTITGPVTLGRGASLAPGASPGTLTTGAQTWEGGSSLTWEINTSEGAEGIDPGWDALKINGALTLNATMASPVTIRAVSLGSNNQPGPAANFDSTKDYVWKVAQTTQGVRGFDAAAVGIDVSKFSNASNGGRWRAEVRGNDLVLVFEGVRPARVTKVELPVAGLLRISFQGVPNQTYRVEATASLAPVNWILAGTVRTSAAGQVDFEDNLAPDQAARFYRVVAP